MLGFPHYLSGEFSHLSLTATMATAPMFKFPPLPCSDEESLGENLYIPVFSLKVRVCEHRGEAEKAVQLYPGKATSIHFFLKEEGGEVFTK